MKYLILLFALPFLLTSILFPSHNNSRPLLSIADIKNSSAVSCGSAYLTEDIDTAANGKFIVPLPGWGHYSYAITTSKDSAQFYFDQGLTMYYSYHPKEAVASFKEAARFDPECAMAWWGQALAMGPNYNSAYHYKMPKGVLPVLQTMNQSAGKASDKEKHIIEIMNLRYSGDTTDANRANLNTAYAQGIKKLIALYPDDPDIKVLYIDAIMLIHAWDFWNANGSPKEWTPEVVALCDSVLKDHPKHPAALHYYIHLTEASDQPGVALANADILKDLLPGVAHMVHMASHEYQRNGLYTKGVEVNDRADDNLMLYDSLAGNLSLSKHSWHFFAVQSYCALSGAMYKTGMRAALRCRKSVSPTYENTGMQNLYMMPELALVRMGKWKEILNDTTRPDERWPGAWAIYHFAKGLAFTYYTGQADSATAELQRLRTAAKDPVLMVREVPFNKPVQRLEIAEDILNAVILFSGKKNKEAISSLKNAIQLEDNLIYSEPKDWMIPARQFLGAYLLKLGKPVTAEKLYREDLKRNPGNGWSLLGLYQSLKAQHKMQGLSKYKAQYVQAFSQADEMPFGSVFME